MKQAYAEHVIVDWRQSRIVDVIVTVSAVREVWVSARVGGEACTVACSPVQSVSN